MKYRTADEIAARAQAARLARHLERAQIEESRTEAKAKARAQGAPQVMTNGQALAGFALLAAFAAWCTFYGLHQPHQIADAAAEHRAARASIFQGRG